MPLREGAVVTPLLGDEDGQSAAARAQEKILRPKGDRLWATVALILSLVTAGLAYYAGTLRADPDIIVNIVNRFQQDSGLQTKGLTVHSADRVVTISGVVHDEVEHAKAIQEAASVRGVKQLIDQIQVAPPTPPTPPAPMPAVVVQVPQAPVPQTTAPLINATISIGGASTEGRSTAAGAVKSAITSKLSGSQKPGTSSPGPDAQKHKGFLNLLKKDKNNQGSLADSKQPADAAKAPDTEKHGFFHFLKKDKNKENKNAAPDKNKKDTTKNSAGH